MKKLCLCLLIILSITPGQSSGHYPLQIGNRWDFGELMGPGQWQLHYTARIVGDTLMSNGHVYSIERTTLMNPFNTRYLRQDGSVVYTYTSQGEVVLYDFSVNDGDTISVKYAGNDTITTVVNIYTGTVLGQSRRTWRYYTRSSATTMYSFMYVADSIGYIGSNGEGGWVESCFGAIINGVQHGTITDIKTGPDELPTRSELYQNYPNPFNPTTTIRYSVGSSSMVTLKVLNILGQEVATLAEGKHEPGTYSTTWETSSISSGIYFCKMIAGDVVAVRRMIVLK